ncbi:hypothetical protein HMPREF9946_02799 [Acetobacteraceae bacterium AT-5844]|nr:hypothetical protein HMPREF9946_02799 [Acetobacteraceae bacterium AT-5844]
MRLWLHPVFYAPAASSDALPSTICCPARCLTAFALTRQGKNRTSF